MVDIPDDDSSTRSGEACDAKQQFEGQQLDIASYIQTGIAKYMSNYSNQKQNATNNGSRTDINFVHEGKKDGVPRWTLCLEHYSKYGIYSLDC